MLELGADHVKGMLAALACGALIGIEREYGKGRAADGSEEAPEERRLAGIRTHILVAAFGALARILDGETGGSPAFSVLGLAALTLYAVVAHGVRAVRVGHYGMTSVPTLLLTYALGVLSSSGHRQLALALAVVVMGILAVKVRLHSFVRALTHEELAASIKFALLALVLLPLLPNHDYGPRDWPWLAARLTELGIAEASLDKLALLNPYSLWLLVIVISGVGFVGYVLVRWLGPGRGLVLTGLVGGIVSSTSVTLAMAEQSKRTPQWKGSISAAVLAACTVMAFRVLVLAVAMDVKLLRSLGPPFGLLMVANLTASLWLARRAGPAKAEGTVPIATPLAISPALKLAGLFFLARLVSEVVLAWIGDAGLLVLAALSGLVDVDPITVAAGQQSAAARIAPSFAALAICTAVATNTIVKGVLSVSLGDRATGRLTLLSLLATLGAGAVGFLLAWA
jgi:uncharacterized membrane protein (DUF4010 family)